MKLTILGSVSFVSVLLIAPFLTAITGFAGYDTPEQILDRTIPTQNKTKTLLSEVSPEKAYQNLNLVFTSVPWSVNVQLLLPETPDTPYLKRNPETEAVPKEYASVDLVYESLLGNFFDVYAGGRFIRDRYEQIDHALVTGFRYILPFSVDTDLEFSGGNIQMEWSGGKMLTDDLSFNWKYNTESEYTLKLDFKKKDRLSLVTEYHSDSSLTLRLNLTF